MKKTIAAASLAASFSAGYYVSPRTELPHAVNASTIRQHDECQRQRESYIKRATDSQARGSKGAQEVSKDKNGK